MNVPTVTYNGLSFINLNKPTNEQMTFLNKNFGFSMLHLEDYLYKTQVPKIEVDDDYSLVVMDVPSISQSKTKSPTTNRSTLPNILSNRIPFPPQPRTSRRKRINIGEVDFFIGKDYLVVLHDDRTPQIDELFGNVQNHFQTPGKISWEKVSDISALPNRRYPGGCNFWLC